MAIAGETSAQMGLTLAVFIFMSLGLLGCSGDDGPASPQETISAPTRVLGPASTAVGTEEIYSTGGAKSSSGHSLEYRFDWGDDSRSQWSCSTGASHNWSTEGGYSVRSRARCKTHTGEVSAWSAERTVAVGEFLSAPNAPSGTGRTDIGIMQNYSTGGASSSSGHGLEYRFDWGDGAQSVWSTSTSASHSWSVEGEYAIKAQSRCATHTERMSVWSGEQTVTVGETISIPTTPYGEPVSQPGDAEVYCSDGSVSSRGHEILYQFDWEGRMLPLWTPSSCASIYWSAERDYLVRVRARCAVHPETVSPWSNAFRVSVTDREVVTAPDTPAGSAAVQIGQEEMYSTGGAVSSHDHYLEYHFDWGDGNESPWSSSTSASHSWSAPGEYVVRAQARCARHTVNISSWSDGLTVTVIE